MELLASVDNWKKHFEAKNVSKVEIFEGKRGTGKTIFSIERMIETYVKNNRNFLYIPTGFEIANIAPYYRKKHGTIRVLGTESLCWRWSDRKLEGECTNRNCRSSVHFYATKPIGHVLFFDIDTREKDVVQKVKEIVFFHGFSHFILTKTARGYHIWICEIVKEKIAFFELFMNLKRQFGSDYVFHGQWILRLGKKQLKKPPRYFAHGINREITNRPISLAHLTLLRGYAKLPNKISQKIVKNQIPVETFARQVLYHSLKELWAKRDDP